MSIILFETVRSNLISQISPLPSEAHLAVAGEGGVVKQEVGTKEEDNGVKHTQACPVEEDGPAEERVLRYVPVEEKYASAMDHTSLTCPKSSGKSP